ncbi:MAG: cytidylate kinase-like family protein, partial [Clostridia bacterium]|nr:cytidylate kinase-like family protein [Clostridia bacterium]
MSKRIITISRQFGSGGHSIGEKVAEKLGIAFYDSEKLTQKIAAETDFDISFIRENDEKAYSGMGMFFDLGIHGGTSFTSLSLYDQLYIAQHNAIREVAEKEPCVIVGRCADYVLEDRDDALHVLIYADNDYRASRILGEYGKRDLKIEKRMKDKDN